MPGGTGKVRQLRAVPRSVQAPDDWAAGYDPRFMTCRGETHAMPYGTSQDHWTEERDGGRLVGYRRTMVCDRCRMIQTDRCDLHGGFTRSCRYPEGYRISREKFGHVGRREARFARLRAQVDEVRRGAGGA
jgi:hypothetical protein